MVHSWAKTTDGTGSAVRVALFDYRKAFDLKDLHILAKKVSFLSMPLFVKCWVIDFLMNRQQLLLLVINDLQPPSVQPWKYIDDTTISEVVPKGSTTNIQTTEKTRTCDLFFKNCKQFPKLKYQLWSA